MNQSIEFELALGLIREEVAASDLLPKPYDGYLKVLGDALDFFLRRLSPRRLSKILEEQAGLPASSTTADRVLALLHHIPALHKLGQVVARDRRLSEEFRQRLQRLESLEARIPVAEITRTLQRELTGWRKAGVQLGTKPLAEGSVAVIMPFQWRSGGRARRREGVFKLLKPGIEELLEEDLEILGSLGSYLDEECERYGLPALDYEDTFETIRELLVHEVRLEQEQANLAEAAKIYSGMSSVQIPILMPFCTPHVTAMERLQGEKITTSELPMSWSSRQAIARTVVEALIAGPVFSPNPAALFHADPHAGNLLVTRKGRLGVLDWSLVGRLRRQDRIQLIQLMLGAITLDATRMAQAVETLAGAGAGRGALEKVLRDSLRELRWGTFPGIRWLTELMDNLVMRAGVRLKGDLLLFRKTLLTLEGVLSDLTDREDQRAIVDYLLATTFVHRWSGEWLDRVYRPWRERSLSTHVSMLDSMSLAWSTPAAITRWWGETQLDFLRMLGVKPNS